MGYWKDSMLIGDAKIDAQHIKLVEAIDELMDACNKGQGRDKIDKTLSFAVNYTKEHFADEERVQAQYAYPEMAEHKRIHAQFLESVSELVDEYNQTGPTIALVGKLNKSLVNWVISHINGEDKKLGEYIKEKTAS